MSVTITRKIEKAGITLKGITVNSTKEVEVSVTGRDGGVSYDATQRKAYKVMKVLGWGGYRCGHGGWVIQKDSRSMGDYMDKASRWHY